jgi:MoxR-like ATPase
MNSGVTAINEAVQKAGSFLRPLTLEMSKVVVGQTYLVERLIIGLLANGHVLLEGVPGLAKTLSVKSLAACLNAKFARLQFTPDMLPADVIGTQIYNPQSGGFTTPTLLAPRSTILNRAGLPPGEAPFLPTSFWPTKSIAPRPRSKARCSRQCRKSR